MIGKHKIALSYAERYCSPNFYEMYKDYVNKFDCKGFPEYQILNRYQDTMQEGLKDSNDFQRMDQYRILLINLMIGGLYKDDLKFR